jgi:MFS family permease
VGVTLGGRLSDKLKPKRIGIRFETELVGILLCVPFILLMAWAKSLPLMIVSVSLFGLATGVYDSNLYASLLEVINPRYRAAATGIFGCGGCIVGALGPAVMGLLNEAFSIRASFASLALFALLGAGLIMIARFCTFKKDIV